MAAGKPNAMLPLEFDAEHRAELVDQLSPEEIAALSTSIPDWLLILTPNHLTKMVKRLARQIDERFAGTELVLVAHSVCFVNCSSYHNSQTQSESVRISPVNCTAEKFQGKSVLLLDELYDNGLTLESVRHYMLSELSVPADHLFSAVAMRKRKSSAAHSPPDFCGIDELPDLWFVGYGLDDCGTKRGWKALWAMPKISGVPLTADDEAFFNADPAVSLAKLRALRQSSAHLLE